MVFSSHFVLEVVATFLKYPDAFFTGFQGPKLLSSNLEKRVNMEYDKHAEIKHTFGFDIYLSPHGADSGTSAYVAALRYWELAPTELFCKILKKE